VVLGVAAQDFECHEFGGQQTGDPEPDHIGGPGRPTEVVVSSWACRSGHLDRAIEGVPTRDVPELSTCCARRPVVGPARRSSGTQNKSQLGRRHGRLCVSAALHLLLKVRAGSGCRPFGRARCGGAIGTCCQGKLGSCWGRSAHSTRSDAAISTRTRVVASLAASSNTYWLPS